MIRAWTVTFLHIKSVMLFKFVCNLRAYYIFFVVFSLSVCGKIYIEIHIGLKILCFAANLAITWIFKGVSQISDMKQYIGV